MKTKNKNMVPAWKVVCRNATDAILIGDKLESNDMPYDFKQENLLYYSKEWFDSQAISVELMREAIARFSHYYRFGYIPEVSEVNVDLETGEEENIKRKNISANKGANLLISDQISKIY